MRDTPVSRGATKTNFYFFNVTAIIEKTCPKFFIFNERDHIKFSVSINGYVSV